MNDFMTALVKHQKAEEKRGVHYLLWNRMKYAKNAAGDGNKIGRYGKFLACPGFRMQKRKPIFEDTGVTCPKCGGRIILKNTKGKIIWL